MQQNLSEPKYNQAQCFYIKLILGLSKIAYCTDLFTGGACDCGDVEVMKPCGFCSRHGPKSSKNFREIPDDVTLMVNLVVPKLIAFLLYKLEDATRDKPNKVTAL